MALDEISARIGHLIEMDGPETLAYSFGTMHGADWGIGERFMNLLGSPNSVGQDKICYAPNAVGEVLTYGWGPTMYTHPVAGITRCEILWGCRPSNSMPLLWTSVQRARKAGGKLVVIDPIRTREAELADLWLQNRPGSDAALALGLIHIVITEGLFDRKFVARETLGFDDLACRAAEYPAERVAQLTWVSPERLTEAARLLAANSPAIVHGSNGLCQSGQAAVQTGRAIACLIALTGNVERLGAHLLVGPPTDITANGEAMLLDALPSEQREKRLGGRIFPFIGSGYGDVGECLGNAWHGRRHALSWSATAHEPSLWRAITKGDPYPVKALILQCHAAVGAAANVAEVIEALRSENLELLVVHDLFLNPTSVLADYVLPAAHWLEKPFFSVGCGSVGFSGDYAEAKAAPLAAHSGHRSDYELFRDLGWRLGQETYWPEKIETHWDDLLRPAGLSFETVAEHVGPLLGRNARSQAIPRRGRRGGTYGTPSGKIEFRSSLLERWGLDPLPSSALTQVLADANSRYPLLLTTGGRSIAGFHQMAQQMESFRRLHPDPVAAIHPSAAAAIGAVDGDWITIETTIGAVCQRACITDEVPERVVHAERWWYPECPQGADDPFGVCSTNINICTDNSTDNSDPVMGSWLLRGLPCRIALSSRHADVGASAPDLGPPQPRLGRPASTL